MTLNTYLDIFYEDAQHRQRQLQYRIKPGALGATTLPTAAKIEAVVDAIFGDSAKPSNGTVTGYAIRLHEDDVTAHTGGSGGSPSSEAVRVRSNVMEPDLEWLSSIGGLNKAAVIFDPSNPNSISTSGAMWDAIRAALTDAAIAVSSTQGSYAAVPSSDLAQTASVYDGRSAPPRPR